MKSETNRAFTAKNKKMYIQPIVEVADVFATSLMQSASPGTLINNGNDTGSIPGGGEIIGG